MTLNIKNSSVARLIERVAHAGAGHLTSLVLFVLMSILLFNLEPPSDSAALKIFNMVAVFMPVGFVVVATFTLLQGFSGYLIKAIKMGFYYAIILTIFGGESGDEMVNFARQSPEDAITIAIAVLLSALGIIASTGGVSTLADTSHIGGAMSPLSMSAPPMFSERVRKYSAAHEAAHALCFAALGKLPPGMEVCVPKQHKRNGGHVTALIAEDGLLKPVFIQWNMLMILAGAQGERLLYGDTSMGAQSDNEHWLHYAKIHLQNFSEGIYYPEPSSDMEFHRNEEKLAELMRSQIGQVAGFLSMNIDVIKELASELLEREVMNKNDLLPYMAKVVIPGDFPKPLGEFDEFSDEWPQNSGYYTKNCPERTASVA